MKAEAAEYQRLFQRLDFFYATTGARLTARKPRSVLLGLVSNWLLWLFLPVALWMAYLAAFEESNRYVAVQQIWACGAFIYWILNAICRQLCWDVIQHLLTWPKEVLTREYPLEYKEIVHKKCKRILHIISMILKWVFSITLLKITNIFSQYHFRYYPVTFVPTSIMFSLKPVFMEYRELPVPVVINGTAAKDFPLPIYVFLYVDFSFNGIIIVFSSISTQIYIAICILFLGNQFEIIVEIIKKLNYDGVREKKRDQRIISDCYMLHLEVIG